MPIITCVIPELVRQDRPDYAEDPAWDRGYELLSKYDLCFDLQAFPAQMEAVARVNRI